MTIGFCYEIQMINSLYSTSVDTVLVDFELDNFRLRGE